MSSEKKGKLIVLYGINNIGKSTQAKLLVERFEEEGIESEYVKYPVYQEEPTGSFINEVLRKGKRISDEELQMWYVLNRYQFEPRLKDMLSRGTYVIAEDYIGTGIAWGMARGIEKSWLIELNKFLIPSDIEIYMKGHRFEESIEDNHRNEQDAVIMKKAEDAHDELAQQYGWNEVDAGQAVQVVHESVWNIISKSI